MNLLNSLSRRTFLHGAGAALALPLLDAMPTAALAAGTESSAAPLRMAWIFWPNGVIPSRWFPNGEGRDWQLGSSLESLSAFKNDLLPISGLAQNNARSLGDGAGDHARSAATFLTGAHPIKTDGANIHVGKSIDQIAADHFGRETRLPSLEIGTEGGRNAGGCDSGYSCAYSNNISWRTPTQPMAKEVNPRLVFERLFGNGAGGEDARKKRMFYRKSILDMVAGQADELQRSVGQTDRHKLDEYFTSLREVESRIERLRIAPAVQRPDMKLPPGVPDDTREHIRLMYDLMVLAFQTDTTRVATFMLANEGSNRSYPMVGVTDAHHGLSHHQNNAEKMDKIAKIDRFFAEEFARFLGRLRDTKEGDANLLRNSLICYGCAIGDGNRHNHDDLPVLLAGHGRGRVNPGRHLKMKDETPLNNLFVSMLEAGDVKFKDIGDATGSLAGLSS